MSVTHSESEGLSQAIEIKSGGVTLPILKLRTCDVAAISAQLRERIAKAPDFFRGAPIAVDVHSLEDVNADIDFRALVRAMRDCGLLPVGICSAGNHYIHAALAAGLARLTLARHETPQQTQQTPSPRLPASKPKTQPEPQAGKLIDQPVRSGQRIYAAGGDLVVISQVSAGAEIMADGNIHVYGVLRGRALAGVQGNPRSRIFCQDLQAELVAICGQYKISENIDDSVRGAPVQIYLQDNSLIIEKI